MIVKVVTEVPPPRNSVPRGSELSIPLFHVAVVVFVLSVVVFSRALSCRCFDVIFFYY